MILKSKLLLISRGREDSRAHRLAIAIVEYAWDRGAEVRVRRDRGAGLQGWPVSGPEDNIAEVSVEDLEWADLTVVLGESTRARDFGEASGPARMRGPRLVS